MHSTEIASLDKTPCLAVCNEVWPLCAYFLPKVAKVATEHFIHKAYVLGGHLGQHAGGQSYLSQQPGPHRCAAAEREGQC